MQSSPSTAPTRQPAVQQGLIFGVIVGVVFAVNTLLGDFLNLGAVTTIIGIILFLAGLFLYAFAGFRASALTGRIAPGTIAGLITGAVGGVIGLIVSLIVTFATVDALRARSQAIADQAHLNFHYTNGLIISAALLGAVIGLALSIGLGAAFGAIGGAIGRRRAATPAQSYQESFYQGLPPTPSQPGNPYPPDARQSYEQPYNPQYNEAPQQNPMPNDSYNQGGYPPQQPPVSNS